MRNCQAAARLLGGALARPLVQAATPAPPRVAGTQIAAAEAAAVVVPFITLPERFTVSSTPGKVEHLRALTELLDEDEALDALDTELDRWRRPAAGKIPGSGVPTSWGFPGDLYLESGSV